MLCREDDVRAMGATFFYYLSAVWLEVGALSRPSCLSSVVHMQVVVPRPLVCLAASTSKYRVTPCALLGPPIVPLSACPGLRVCKYPGT